MWVFIDWMMSHRHQDHDQCPKTEPKGDPPTQVDSEESSYEVIDNQFQPAESPHLEAPTRPQIECKLSQYAHCDMSARYGRLKEDYEAVYQDRDHLKDRLHRSKLAANDLRDQLAATRAELVQVRQDLQASRSFVSTEASDDGKTLVDMLSVLNQKIDEFAYVVGDLVPPHMGEARFAPPETDKGLGAMGPLETLGVFATQTSLSLADFLQYGIQHVTCRCLLDILFMQFAPLIDRSLSHHLNELHRSLSMHYPQAYGGRWRAMTYSHIRPQQTGPSESARWWVEHTLAIVNFFAPGCHPAKGTLPKNALEKATEMFRAAIALQDKARIAYLAYNYEVFAVDLHTPFKEGEMNYGGDDRKKQKGHGGVVAVLGLGLKAWRSVPGDEGQYVREEVIPVRVSVLTNV